MKLLPVFLLALALGAQTKTNLTDLKAPPAPPAPVYLVGVFPGVALVALDPASFRVDTSTSPPTLRAVAAVPPGTAGGVLWDDAYDVSLGSTFSTSVPPIGRVYTYKNGVLMQVGVDYAQATAGGLVTVTFLPAQGLTTGDKVRLLYQK